jgi:hypothetical protein
LRVVWELEARVGIEPTHKGFADPLVAHLKRLSSIDPVTRSLFCPTFVHLINPPFVGVRDLSGGYGGTVINRLSRRYNCEFWREMTNRYIF